MFSYMSEANEADSVRIADKRMVSNTHIRLDVALHVTRCRVSGCQNGPTVHTPRVFYHAESGVRHALQWIRLAGIELCTMVA